MGVAVPTGRAGRRSGASAAGTLAAALAVLALPLLSLVTGCREDAGPRTAFVSSEVTGELDLPFSEAARHGDLLFLSGMIGIEPGTLELVPGGLEAEARRALENIRLMLAEVGATPDDVLRCTVMMDDIEDWSRFNRVYVDFFGDHRPARSAFGADGLALGAAVEIECVAAVPAGSRPRP